ncbi:MAG TPA: hypothetical protein VFN67_13755 [Polyangiales bacterium]|nr:hypothetical protein [Polyangiales bacterium]
MLRHLVAIITGSMFLGGLSHAEKQPMHALGKPLVVIVAASSPMSDISTSVLRRVFLGEAEFAHGKRLIPINHALQSPERVSFDRSLLGLKPTEVGAFWIDRRIRDQGHPPKTVPSADLVIRVVMSLPGAISYVHTDQLNDKIRALTIDGHGIDSPDYLLAE